MQPSPCGTELNIHDLLQDPLILTVMRADGVDQPSLRQMLGTVAVAVQQRQADYEPKWRAFPPARGGASQMRAQLCGAC